MCEECETLTRRGFLKGAVLTTLPVALPAWMPRLAFAPPGKAPRGDVLVCIFQRGAMDGLNAIVPHGESAYYDARPQLGIPAPKSGDDKSAIDLGGFFGLHPALRSLKDVWDAKHLAIVHAAGSPDPTHSHFDAMDFMERGTPGKKQIPTGWLGRHLQITADANDSPFRAVGFGAMLQTSLRGPVPATALKSIAEFHLQGRQDAVAEFQKSLAAMYAGSDALAGEGRDTFDAVDLLTRANPAQYQPSKGVTYPQTEFGLAMIQVAQLVKADIGLEVACVDIGGWDTHANEGGADGQMARLLKELSDGLAAFHADLLDRMKDITLVTMSEFGRRVQENASGGTDHGHGNVMLVMGGQGASGKVYWDWLRLSHVLLYGCGHLAITTEFCYLSGEFVQKRLLNDKLPDVFPDYSAWNFRNILTQRA